MTNKYVNTSFTNEAGKRVGVVDIGRSSLQTFGALQVNKSKNQSKHHYTAHIKLFKNIPSYIFQGFCVESKRRYKIGGFYERNDTRGKQL